MRIIWKDNIYRDLEKKIRQEDNVSKDLELEYYASLVKFGVIRS